MDPNGTWREKLDRDVNEVLRSGGNAALASQSDPACRFLSRQARVAQRWNSASIRPRRVAKVPVAMARRAEASRPR